MGPARRLRALASLVLTILAPAVLGLGLFASAFADEEWTSERPDDDVLPMFSLERISFEGEYSASEDDLRDAMKSSTSGLLRFRPVSLERLEGDVLRIRNLLRRRGHWNPRVRLQLLFEHEKRKTHAVFDVREGRKRSVGEVRVQGHQTLDAEQILSHVKQRPGDAFDVGVTDRDRTAIEDLYANQGFYLVQVTADIQAATSDDDPIIHDLVYVISEGRRFFVDEIVIVGNEFTKDEIIRRELAIHPGEVLSRERLEESRSLLYATGFFSRVELLPGDAEESLGRIDVTVRVTERTMRFVGAGIGYGTRDQLRLSGEWGHRNLWGRGKRANVRGILATELFPADLVRTRLEGRYVEPHLFRTRTTATGEVFYERSREVFREDSTSIEGEYALRLVGLSIDVNRALMRYTRGWVSLENEWADLDPRSGPPPPSSARPDLTRTIGLTLEQDRRNDYFAPERGSLHRFIGSVSGGVLGGDNDFWRTQFEMSWFRPVRGVTLAGRVRVGYSKPYGQSVEIPDRERFKLGGATTVRGYREQEIGAGDFALLTNVEVRFPLFWVVEGGVFVDGGNAWPEVLDVRWEDFDLDAQDDPVRSNATDYRYSAGTGIRFATPVGPVRLDWGRKLKILPAAAGQSVEDKWRIHLSLGHVF